MRQNQENRNNSNVFSTGGGGNVFEVSVQTAFVITAMLNGRIPSLPIGKVESIRLQADSATDDLVVSLISPKNQKHKLLVQVKHSLTFTENNDVFIDVIGAFWSDYNNEQKFNRENDKLLIVVGESNNKLRNHIKPVLDWAVAKQSWEEFSQELKSSVQKQAVFDVFMGALKTVTQDSQELKNETVWRFLQNVRVVDYDFSSATSTHRSYVKSMIDLAKRDNVFTTSDEIWGVVYGYVAHRNTEGATLKPEELISEFDYFADGVRITESTSMRKLQNESQVLFDGLQNTIGGVHIDRNEVFHQIIPKFNKCQVIILSGDAGVGKSAFAKDLLMGLADQHIIAFAADQFQRPRLGITLSEMGVTEDITQMFSRVALQKNQIIYVDSMEKLLEGSADAFKELVILLQKNSQIKLVATCRDYAVQPLVFEYLADFRNRDHIRIPNFSKQELKLVSELCPELKPILANRKLTSLLNRPKYLEFAQKLITSTTLDVRQMNQVTFLNELWNKIIKKESITTGNIHEKRSKVFIEVAIRRAEKMALYVDVSELDDEALYALERDGILLKHNEQYAPAHDILEDWALIRHIGRLGSVQDSAIDFFTVIGTTPAIRRGFRLWLEDELLRDGKIAYVFIQGALFDSQIANHWKDEIIIAILNSEFCYKFLKDNSNELLLNDANFLTKFLHLLRVACKDLDQMPAGNGWNAIVRYLHEHIDTLASHHSLILEVMLDWDRKVGAVHEKLPDESEKVGQIVFRIIHQLEGEYDGYYNGRKADRVDDAIKMVFRLTEVVQLEVQKLLLEAFNVLKQKNDEGWRIRRFCEKVIEFALSGLHSGTTSKFFPELIVQIANEHWLEEDTREQDEVQGAFGNYESFMGIEQYFGLREYGISNYMPASTRQTFVSKFLLFHPLKAMTFIVDFINLSTIKYVNSTFGKDDDCKQLEIWVGDELIAKQWGSYLLWMMYRGKGKATPYLLQSILKALENYLFSLGGIGKDWAFESLQTYTDFLIKKSNNVAVTSVLAITAMAYPRAFGKKLLYFVSNIEFLSWDSNRWIEDQTGGFYFPPSNADEVIFNHDSKDADGWEHRKKHYRGLHQFLVDYQFNIRELNEQIFAEFDRIKISIEEKDIYARKTFSEIDVRNWKPGKYDDKHGGFTIQPKYDSDVQEMVESFSKEQAESNKDAELSSWIKSVHSNEFDKPDFKKWKECYKHYQKKSKEKNNQTNRLLDVPGTLACIGFRYFSHELTGNMVIWCSETILKIASTILTNQGMYGEQDFSTSIFDRKPVLSILPDLLCHKAIPTSTVSELKIVIFMLLLRMDAKHERPILAASFKKSVWSSNPDFGRLCFYGLLEYADFASKHHSRGYRHHPEEKAKVDLLEEGLFTKIFKGDYKILNNWSQFSYKHYSHWYLNYALQIVPTSFDVIFVKPFLCAMYKAHMEGIDKSERNHSSNYFEIGGNLKIVIAEYLILQPIEQTGAIVDFILELVALPDMPDRHSMDKLNIAQGTFKSVIRFVDSNWDDDSKPQVVPNFWQLWAYFSSQISRVGLRSFTDVFLLNIDWKYSAEHWVPLESGHDFLASEIQKLSTYDVNTLIKLIGGVGFQTLAPQGISWITAKAFDAKGMQKELLNFDSTEKLVERCFRVYGKEIKGNRSLLFSYLMILDVLMRMGSSKAYFIRESVLLYKESVDHLRA